MGGIWGDHALGIRPPTTEIRCPQKAAGGSACADEEFIGGIQGKVGELGLIDFQCLFDSGVFRVSIDFALPPGSLALRLDIGGYEVSTRIPFLLYH